MTRNADGSICIGQNIVVRRSRLFGVFVIANDEDEAFVETEYVDEVIEALQLLRGSR
jgi:hypothetical protein